MHKAYESREEPSTLIRDIWHVIFKRRWMIVSFFLSVVASVALLTALQKVQYTAKGTLWVDREPNMLAVPDVLQIETPDIIYFQSQFALLKSRTIAGEVIDKKRLFENPHFVSRKAAPQPDGGPPDPATRESLIDKLLKGITVNPLRDTRIVQVTFKGSDPRFVADTLNALFEAFVELNIRRKYTVSEEASKFLSTQIEQIRSDIETLETRLQKYGVEKNIVSLSASETTVVNTLADVNRALSAATIDRIEKEARYNEIKNAPLGNISGVVNSLVQRLSEEYLRLNREYARRLEVVKPEYPEMIQLKKELDSAREALENETAKLISASFAEYQAAVKNERSLQGLFEKKKLEAQSLNSNSIFYNSLRIEIQNKNTLLEELLRRQSETVFSARLQEAGTSNVWIVDRAAVPIVPSSPNKKLNMILAVFVGLVGGVGLAFLFEYINGVVKGPRDILLVNGLPTLGFITQMGKDGAPRAWVKRLRVRSREIDRRDESKRLLGRRNKDISQKISGDRGEQMPAVPLFRGKDKDQFGLIASQQPGSIVTENFRSVRTTILISSPPEKIKCFLISSPLAEEGKSSVVSNLGIVLAQSHKRVVIIDGDLRKPRQDKIFGIPSTPGLINLLMRQVDLQTVTKPTEIPNLFVIPSGPRPPDPIELLGSDKMDETVAILKKDYDFLLFDSPPLLVFSDAIAIGPMIDRVIIVAREGKTTLSALIQAKRKLDAHHLKCFGVILNGSGAFGHGSYYVHQYHRYYE